MGYSVTRDAETRAIQAAVDANPEGSAADIAQAALDELWEAASSSEEEEAAGGELDLAFENLRRRAAAEWACPE